MYFPGNTFGCAYREGLTRGRQSPIYCMTLKRPRILRRFLRRRTVSRGSSIGPKQGRPRSVKALMGSSPRVIADDVWAKLLWAGLNLTPEDFERGNTSDGKTHTFYLMELIRALTLVWLFAGLRGDEIRRLRVGCVQWQQDNAASVCFLDVPVNKTGTAFTKPVDKVVGQVINAWEKIRPPQVRLRTMFR